MAVGSYEGIHLNSGGKLLPIEVIMKNDIPKIFTSNNIGKLV